MREPTKPPALIPGCKIAVVTPASPADPARLERGCHELARLGYSPDCRGADRENGIVRPATDRQAELVRALANQESRAVFCARGGYGSSELLDGLNPALLQKPKIVLGYSDITALQVFLWQKLGWVTLYGPMAAAGFDAGANVAAGYDAESFRRATTQTRGGWSFDLHGAALVGGKTEGVLLGGCLTLVETTLATPWELDTDGAILLLEDRGMKPYQIDRALVHLRQAGKLRRVRGIILGEFPDCPPQGSEVTVPEVLQHALGDLGVPVVWRVPIGHTTLPMLTLPLGVRARLHAANPARLEILEPAVVS